MSTLKKGIYLFLLICLNSLALAVKYNQNKQHFPRQFPLPATPELYASIHAIKQPKKYKSRWHPMCPTIDTPSLRAPNDLREMGYEALRYVGHHAPEKVYILSEDKPDVSYENKLFDGNYIELINYPLKNAKKESYGLIRCSMFHEAVHAKCKHVDGQNYIQCQNEEREADKIGVIQANCKNCAKEYAKFFSDNHNVYNENNKFAFDELEKLSNAELEGWLPRLRKLSDQEKTVHPIELERTVTILLYSRSITNLCAHHKTHPAQL